MKKTFSFLFVLTMFATKANAYTVKTFQPLQQTSSIPQIQKLKPLIPLEDELYENESYPKITELELSVFNRSFENENIYNRLTRLENRILRRNYSGLPLSNRVDNLLSNVDEGIFYGIKNSDLIKLEKRVFGALYPNDDTATRITRLEKEMLGAMQSGNLRDRFETVKLAAKHYNTYPEIVKNQAIFSSPNRNYQKHNLSNYNGNWNGSNGLSGFMQNFLDKFFGPAGMGTITGFTPPIYDQYNQYASFNGYNPNTGFREYNAGNTGGYYQNKGYGNSSSVRILD